MKFEFRKRYDRILYTLKHKKAFLKVEKQLRGKNTLHGYLHDWDKPFLYLAFWIDLKKVQKIHRLHSKHHVRNTLDKTRDDLIDTIIDWECARLTKPDKPLNAYQTLLKFYPEHTKTFLPLIKELLPGQVPSEFSSVAKKPKPNVLRHNEKLRPHPKKQATSVMLQHLILTQKSR